MRSPRRRGQSSPWRSVAAAANGPITRLMRVRAHRIVNGAPNGTGPTIAASAADTPKIKTGTVSGSTRTGSRRPPRRSATASAAPITPMNERLHRNRELERRRAHQNKVERAVLVIGCEQAVKNEQQSEQRTKPQDR